METEAWRARPGPAVHFNRWVEPPEALGLERGLVDVWRLELAQPGEVIERMAGALSEEERERAERFRVSADRRAFVLTRAFLRGLIVRYLDEPGLGPRDVELDVGPWGKPELAHPSSLEFNVSHSGEVALLSFARGCPVGVDVEQVRVDYEAHTRIRRFFTEGEISAIEALDEAEQVEAFFRCWTRKEAFMKATGKGFRLGMDAFSVSVGDASPRLLAWEEGDPAAWQIFSLEVGPNHAAAVVVGDRGAVQLRTMSATVSKVSSVQRDL